MKSHGKEIPAGRQSAGVTVAALVLVALVPAVCVLWFMSVAMRNERLAVQEQLAGVYVSHLGAVQKKMAAHWKERQDALATIATGAPAEMFAAIVRANLADSVVIHDAAGKPLYPEAAMSDVRDGDKEEWAAARALEFRKQDYAAAADAYARLAESSQDIHAKARALQSQAACLLKAGRKTAAFVPLTQVAADDTLRNAISAQGTWLAPNAQLLLLKLLAEEPANDFLRGLMADTLTRLVERLNDYSGAGMPAGQRTFLMREVVQLLDTWRSAASGGAAERNATEAPRPETAQDSPASPAVTVNFSTLIAEELAAAYLERGSTPPAEAGLQRTLLANSWRLAVPDRHVVALFREDRLKDSMASLIDSLALPDVRVTLLAPGESLAASKLVPPHEVGEFMPGWRLGLSFKGTDPLVRASERQARFYLSTGSLVVFFIGILAWFVARYVSAQMRLARLKNELVSTVSHELKTPLASMRALVDTLSARRYRDDRQLHEYLDLIGKENLRLGNLIENFLTFSRLERGKEQLRFEDVAPDRVVVDAADSLKEKLGSADCHFEQHVSPDLPRIRGDAGALSTVLINLLDNAHKYTDANKHIVVRVKADERHVCFEVADNGIGFNRREAKKIFERFYQVDQTLTRQRGGCGLGLGIVNYIVRAHGGTVEVESEPGKGSTFRVKIPLAKTNASREADRSFVLQAVDRGFSGTEKPQSNLQATKPI